MNHPIRILGIDPGLRRTGWGLVAYEGNRLSFLACGSVSTNDKAPLAMRLLTIHEGLRQVLAEHAPDEAAVECTFVNRDGAATLKLGQARGVAMLAPALYGLAVAEYAPNVVKKTVVGAGHGDKDQIRMMIGVLLPKADPKTHDAADALAIAITHAHHRQSLLLRVADDDLPLQFAPTPTLPRKRERERTETASRCAAMIGKLRGVVDSYGEDFVILDVQGVGYHVHCSARTLQALPAAGEAATLSIDTYVREDMIRLYGFVSDGEREWFRMLQTVQGVGAKVALAVLGTLGPVDLASAIALRDKAAVARTPGVGPKVAERIVAELKDKAPAFADIDPAVARLSGAMAERNAPRPLADAVSALVNLGYGQPQAAAAIAAAAREAGEGAETAKLIRLGLKELSK